MVAWFYLFLAGIFEVVWATSMKESHGFTRLIPSLITVVFMTASVILLAYSMKQLPLGTAYTVWVGIGAVGAFVFGIIMFSEVLSLGRVIAALLIISGIIVMKLTS